MANRDGSIRRGVPTAVFWLLAIWIVVVLATLVWGVGNAESQLRSATRAALAERDGALAELQSALANQQETNTSLQTIINDLFQTVRGYADQQLAEQHAEIAATLYERCMEFLEAPIGRVAGFDTPFPYTLEHEYMPNAKRVLDAVRKTLEW